MLYELTITVDSGGEHGFRREQFLFQTDYDGPLFFEELGQWLKTAFGSDRVTIVSLKISRKQLVIL